MSRSILCLLIPKSKIVLIILSISLWKMALAHLHRSHENLCLEFSDRSSNRGIDRGSRLMIEALDNLGMISIPSSGFYFTWSNRRNGRNRVNSRLDRGMANEEWWGLFANASIELLPQTSSDHNPQVLSCFGQQCSVKRPFRFEAAWVEDQRSFWVVNHAWGSRTHPNPPTRLLNKCQATRVALSRWNKNQLGNIQSNIKATREALANNALIRIPDREEIRTTIFRMGSFKAAGPDGLPALLFKSYWGSVGEDIIAAVRDFFVTGNLHPAINSTNIVLVPKIKHPTTINHYRPIAVCNVIYKAISKLLADRLRPFLSSLICPTQNAFVPGRSIHDNSVLIQEVIHAMKKKKGTKGWMGMKIDIQKAYDRLSWQFLEAVLKAFGFHPKWIQWIVTCCSTPKMTLMLNGAPIRSFFPKRGLRQGDPLSPYLFILCMEVLSRLINKKVADGLISGFKISRHSPALHHLFFADDVFLMGKCTINEAFYFKECLDDFCRWSGQSFNALKSNIFFNPAASRRTTGLITAMMGFSHISPNSTYLGLPLFRSGRNRDFNFLVEQLDSKLAGWKARTLSKAKKLILIKSVALALIREGACYVVGDGCSIDPWKDPWVPNIPNFLPVPISEPSVSNNRVKDFFLQQGLWDFAKLAFHYSPADVQAISTIRLPIRPKPDRWVWTPMSNGNFSTRSAYLLYNKLRFSDQNHLPKEIWLKIWGHKRLLPRHKLLWWHFLSNAFPTREKLNSIFHIENTSCPICSVNPEDALHLLFFSVIYRNIVLFASVLFDLIWQHRNGVTHGGVIENPTIVYRRISVVYSELLGVLPSPPPRSLLAWSPPPADWIKVNFDAAVGISGAAVACIARRSDGSVVRWASRLVNSTIPLISEGFAAELAVDLACEAQWQAVVFEGDSKSVVDSFSARSWSSFWSLSSVVQNCLFKLNSVSVWSFIFAPRACNLMAHNLARWSLNTLSSAQGASVLPSVVYSDLVVDSSL
ncbi:hypothetical protein UlMin_012018 [Ulmus minor]